MKILAHRGYWQLPAEKNNIAAFERALQLGFGIETDVRDLNGQLVVSHDPPLQDASIITWQYFLHCYQQWGADHGHYPTIATNIKADGLADLLWASIPTGLRSHFFFFDMAVPDALAYVRLGAQVFTRHSELEKLPAFYHQAQGVWMDEFSQAWITADVMLAHIRAGKSICLVSPELQKRPHLGEWQQWKKAWSQWSTTELNKVMLCTDFPEEAEKFFKKV